MQGLSTKENRIQLRDYQEECIAAIETYWSKHPGKFPVVAMPTGSGKTVVFAELIRRLLADWPALRVLVMAHRKELVSQSAAKILEIWPEAPVGVFAASLKRREIKQITVASRDSIASTIEDTDYAPQLVIIDEAHHIATKEDTRYRKIISTIQDRYPAAMFLGVSATPYRAGSGLIYGDDRLFHGLAYQVRIKTLIEKSYLAPIRALGVNDRAEIDTGKVKIINGEFNQKDLARASEKHSLVKEAVKEWYEVAYKRGRKHTLFFGVSVVHAEIIQSELATYGLKAPLITGKTKQAERDEILKRFANRKLAALVSVSVLTEGTDLPCIDCIANLRAIASLGLWLQIVGRGMRTDEGKTDCLVLDYGQCIDRFGPIDIAAPAIKRTKKEPPRTKTCPECQTKIGFYRLTCDPPCNHRFAPKVHKICPNCKHECGPKAIECPACGESFARHDANASTQSLLSDSNQYQKLTVYSVTSELKESQRTGNKYLQVTYHTEAVALNISKILAIGHMSVAGEHADNEWKRITRDDISIPLPTTPEMANTIGINWQQKHFRPVKEVVIDKYHPYKRIVAVIYAEQEPAQRAS